MSYLAVGFHPNRFNFESNKTLTASEGFGIRESEALYYQSTERRRLVSLMKRLRFDVLIYLLLLKIIMR